MWRESVDDLDALHSAAIAAAQALLAAQAAEIDALSGTVATHTSLIAANTASITALQDALAAFHFGGGNFTSGVGTIAASWVTANTKIVVSRTSSVPAGLLSLAPVLRVGTITPGVGFTVRSETVAILTGTIGLAAGDAGSFNYGAQVQP